MSRSYRKTSITGICATSSERYYKRLRAKKERRAAKLALLQGRPCGFELVPWDEWETGRDGKFIFNPKERPELLRK